MPVPIRGRGLTATGVSSVVVVFVFALAGDVTVATAAAVATGDPEYRGLASFVVVVVFVAPVNCNTLGVLVDVLVATTPSVNDDTLERGSGGNDLPKSSADDTRGLCSPSAGVITLTLDAVDDARDIPGTPRSGMLTDSDTDRADPTDTRAVAAVAVLVGRLGEPPPMLTRLPRPCHDVGGGIEVLGVRAAPALAVLTPFAPSSSAHVALVEALNDRVERVILTRDRTDDSDVCLDRFRHEIRLVSADGASSSSLPANQHTNSKQRDQTHLSLQPNPVVSPIPPRSKR